MSDETALTAIMSLLQPHLQAANIDPASLDAEASLIDLGVVDSFMLVDMLVELQERLGVEIDFMELTPDDFATINGLLRAAREASA